MPVEIAPTPVLQGESAKRFTRILWENRKTKTYLTPTPQLKELTEKILNSSWQPKEK